MKEPMAKLAISLTQEDVRYLDALAAKWRVPRSRVLREIVTFFMQHETTPAFILSTSTDEPDGQAAD